MSHPDDLVLRRIDRADKNDQYTPVELLRATAREIETGRIAPTSLVIIHLKAGEDSTDYGVVRCNIDRMTELGLYYMAAEQTLRSWKDP